MLRRRLERTQADLETTRRVIAVQGNVSALLEELPAKGASDRARRPRQLADLEAGRVPARRPRRPQDAQPGAHVDRQPSSEAQFKTLKYRPGFPARFDSIDKARACCREFFDWYNHQHRHSGIGLMTPATAHHGLAEQTHADRSSVLDAAFAARPERFRPPAAAAAGATPTTRRLHTKFTTELSHLT